MDEYNNLAKSSRKMQKKVVIPNLYPWLYANGSETWVFIPMVKFYFERAQNFEFFELF